MIKTIKINNNSSSSNTNNNFSMKEKLRWRKLEKAFKN